MDKKHWWQDKIAYQIYPKSFQDSNDDGIGDIAGIISRLDHLKDLGIGLLWISPMYVSPLADQGYDIANYYRIDPRFGTMEQMKELIRKAKKRDISVIFDLVVNHCSDEHEWFKRACEDPYGKYGRYFYIEKRKPDGSLPTNWRSYFGGPVWTELPGHSDLYYLHSFHRKQPDLNWTNREVREEIYRMVNWWLDFGIGGFRIDAIMNIKKAMPFRDYPADRRDGLCAIQTMLREANGIGEYLSELRDLCFKPHDAFTVGEVFDGKEEEIPDFIGEKGYFSSMFDFRSHIFGTDLRGWYASKQIGPEDYKNCIFSSQEKTKDIGFISNIIENHDEPRGVSCYIRAEDLGDHAKMLLATVYFCLKGIPWIYQGQEIGMENLPVTDISEVDDISARDQYQRAIDAGLEPAEALRIIEKRSRDNARTPFQWDSSAHAGFTKSKPWLRVNPNYTRINLASQRENRESVYSYYKGLSKLRRNPRYLPTFVYGDFAAYRPEEKGLLSYFRDGERKLWIVGNFQKDGKEVELPEDVKETQLRYLYGNVESLHWQGGKLCLKGYDAVIMEMIKSDSAESCPKKNKTFIYK